MVEEKKWEVITSVTQEDVDLYYKNGYGKLGRVFSEEEHLTLKNKVDTMIANIQEGVRPEELDLPHLDDPFFFNYLASPKILDIVEQFIGPDIALWSSHIIAKRAGDGLGIPWHQDGAYWIKMLEPMKVITVWLAVDESNLENGCMSVIPGSHDPSVQRKYRKTIEEGQLFSEELEVGSSELSNIVHLELEEGESSLHDAWTVHGSQSNKSVKRRCGYTMRYMPASVKCHHKYWGEMYNRKVDKKHNIYLLRGQDRTGGYNEYTPLPE